MEMFITYDFWAGFFIGVVITGTIVLMLAGSPITEDDR